MHDTLTLPAPAKVNLFLHILGRRPDGYHELQTLFQLIAASDQLTFTPQTHSAITLDHDLPFATEDNLIIKAARLLQRESACQLGVHIELVKQLPFGGGLGGGSSDAATTLLALNLLWDLHWPLARLATLGLQLGADVPVFVQGRTAWGEGIGEHLKPVDLPETTILVLTPDAAVSTASIFQHTDLPRKTPPLSWLDYQQGVPVRNDCEPLVRRLYPAVAEALDYLAQADGQPGHLSGTGSSVFKIASDPATAQRWLEQAPCRGFISQTCNVSPLHRAIAQKSGKSP